MICQVKAGCTEHMMPLEGMTISEIVRKDYRTADIFKKFGISYCCGGQVDLLTACAMKSLDPDLVNQELEAVTREFRLSASLPFVEWKPDFLVDYIMHIHHSYLRQVLPSLTQQLSSFVPAHEAKYPQFKKIEETFITLAQHLFMEMQHEETVIFPYIRQVYRAYEKGDSYGALLVKTLRKPMRQGNGSGRQEKLMGDLRSATNSFGIPKNACTNFHVIYKKMEGLDRDLQFHNYLEQSILFPKTEAMEQQLLRQ
jgi:regulator of cell morphogenesis and NO signaling